MDALHVDADKIFCRKCLKFYSTDDFELNKKGKRNRTCKRHSRKRALELDDWDSFTRVLRNWNKSASTFQTPDMQSLDWSTKNFSNLIGIDSVWPQVIYDAMCIDNDELIIQFWLSDLTLRDAMNDMKALFQL